MGDSQTGACCTCFVFRPDADPRIPNFPPVCDGDRTLIDRHLVDISNLIADLSNPEAPIVDDREHERFGTAHFPGGVQHQFSKGLKPSDPLAVFGGVAPINSRSKQPSVSGTRDKVIPINADTHDLKAAARVPNPTPQSRDWPQDQIGRLSAATTLDQWVRDWRDLLFPDQHLPNATVDELVMWLRNRLPDACDHHPAIDEFAAEMKALRGGLRFAAGITDPQPQRIEGVRCGQCKKANVLFDTPDDTYRAECGNCGLLYTVAEYDEHVKISGGKERNNRTEEEVLNLLRPNRIRSSFPKKQADTPQNA